MSSKYVSYDVSYLSGLNVHSLRVTYMNEKCFNKLFILSDFI